MNPNDVHGSGIQLQQLQLLATRDLRVCSCEQLQPLKSLVASNWVQGGSKRRPWIQTSPPSGAATVMTMMDDDDDEAGRREEERDVQHGGGGKEKQNLHQGVRKNLRDGSDADRR